MQIPTRLLVLPLLVAYPERAAVTPQLQPAQSGGFVQSDRVAPSVRWNRLVPKFVDEAAAARQAARAAAKAAGDSLALRRIAQTPPPFLFRIYTLLSISQYAAATAARDDRGASANAAVAAASAAVLTQLFT
ncbi:MAG: hypothetical protein ACJ8AE_12905, partial [Gemmatimonadaceae bacterium]